MPIKNLPPLRDIIKEFNLSANKSLGQNFLLDSNVTAKIASLADPLENNYVIEIGPGPGGLTRALLDRGAKIIAIETDERFRPVLTNLSKAYNNNLEVIYGDALKQNYSEIASKCTTKPKIIANLPYNIATQLLLNWLVQPSWPPFYESLILMFQKEVAERITAQAGQKAYGRLSILANWRCYIKIIYNLPAAAFTPRPKVDSAIVQLIPKTKILNCNVESLEKITFATFSQRRKMLRQSLKNLGGIKLIESAKINPERRPETLTLEEFVALAKNWQKATNPRSLP